MTKNAMKLAVSSALLLGLISQAYADVKLNENITFSGYAAGAYMNYNPSPGREVHSTFDGSKPIPGGGDANDILARLTFNYKPFTAVASLNYFPKIATNEFSLLDAYVTYDAGEGLSLTAGKFLSYFGYESFYPSLMDQISYANGDFLGAIPGYHTGLRVDYAAKTFSVGFAAVDSVYSPNGPTRGDNEIRKNGGGEFYASYTGITDLTLWAGILYDSQGGFQSHSVFTMDYWASYNLDKANRLAAEFVFKNGGNGAEGYNWLIFLNHTFTEKISTAFRISGEAMRDGGPSFNKFTIAPAYNITPNLLVRGEYSRYEYSSYTAQNADFWGAQVVYKF